MNWVSMGRGEEGAELELALERLDAIQARLELLERDRDTRLREAAADLRDRRARERELEAERDAAVKSAIEFRLRVEASEAELVRARTELDQLNAQVETLLHERRVIAELVERAASSRAWRVGHRMTSIVRFATFHRTHGTSALGRLQARLAAGPRELPAGSDAGLNDDGSEAT